MSQGDDPYRNHRHLFGFPVRYDKRLPPNTVIFTDEAGGVQKTIDLAMESKAIKEKNALLMEALRESDRELYLAKSTIIGLLATLDSDLTYPQVIGMVRATQEAIDHDFLNGTGGKPIGLFPDRDPEGDTT